MSDITASMVKALREKTGAGMMDCKKALIETNGDMEKASDWLRKKGIAQAEKKSGRVAAEGLVAVATQDNKGVAIEVNAETDFVARNADFQNMTKKIVEIALENEKNIQNLANLNFDGKDQSISEHIAEMVGVIGENMSLRRAQAITVENGVVVSYVHGHVAQGMGKIAVIVALNSNADKGELKIFAKQIAMHIAATAPVAIDKDSLDPKIVEKERAILHAQALEEVRKSGKPDQVAEKMVEGRIRKFYQDAVLLQQIFVINDNKETVEQAIEKKSQTLAQPIKVEGFIRFEIGEGIEKEKSDFAAEVVSAAAQ